MSFRIDAHEKFHRRLHAGFFVALWSVILGSAAVAYVLHSPFIFLPSLLLLPLSARGLASAVVDVLINVAPRALVALMHRGWHGTYRAFEGFQVRVVEGEDDTPSTVVADDLLQLLEQPVSALDRRKLAARFPGDFFRSDHPLADGEWVFTDAGSLLYLHGLFRSRDERGETARRLAAWLEREVFRPIDNRRTATTGRAYRFTTDGHIKGRPQRTPEAFRSERPLPPPAA